MGDEQVRKAMFPMKRVHHDFLADPQNRAIGHGCGRTHAESLARKRAFTEKITASQYPDRRFLPGLRDHGEFDLARLNINTAPAASP